MTSAHIDAPSEGILCTRENIVHLKAWEERNSLHVEVTVGTMIFAMVDWGCIPSRVDGNSVVKRIGANANGIVVIDVGDRGIHEEKKMRMVV